MSYIYLGRIYYQRRPLRPGAGTACEKRSPCLSSCRRLPAGQPLRCSGRPGERLPTIWASFDAALEAAERALAIDRELGSDREIAAGLGQIAANPDGAAALRRGRRPLREALRAAQAAGDLELQGITPPAPGHLAATTWATTTGLSSLYQQAITLFQRADNPWWRNADLRPARQRRAAARPAGRGGGLVRPQPRTGAATE